MVKYQYSAAFAVGAFAYTVIEILWRGHTHWTMTLTGGACLALLFMWSRVLSKAPLAVKCVVGALTITAVEFAVGVTVNIIFRVNVWDYSRMPFNLMGQVCLGFSVMWCLLSAPAFYVCELIKKYVNIEGEPHTNIGVRAASCTCKESENK